MKRNTLTLIALLLVGWLMGQDKYAKQPVKLKPAKTEIKQDGNVKEEAWFRGQPAKHFWELFPTDSLQVEVQTEIFMTYDEDFLYVAAICHSQGDDYVTPSLRRDFRAGGSDNLTLLFDTFRDKTNAFVFGINPYGVMREALISNGGQNPRTDFDESWDNKWTGVAKIHDGYWTCEMAIPFTTLRFQDGQKVWNFNSYRFDTQSNTRSSWVRVPQNQSLTSLAYVDQMVWEEAPQSPGTSVSVIPFITSGFNQTYMDEVDDELVRVDEDPNYNFDIGGDAKIAVTPGLNLDLTVNPDFSQVEVDQQVINLGRFEVFFPERRQFFLENADLFGGFGDSRINPFFSRRIGIAEDTTGNNIQVPIYAGARLSGKLDKNWRIGLLNMQTDQEERANLPGYNYTVMALQRKVFNRSNFGLIFVNKQTFDELEDPEPEAGEDEDDVINRYNRVVGFDYNLASSNNEWNGKAYYQHSFSPEQGGQPYAYGTSLEYRIRPISIRWDQQLVGEDYEAEVGFVPRTGFLSINPEIRSFFYPKKGPFNQHGPGFEARILWQPGFGKADHEFEAYWDADFNNTSGMRATLSNESTFLFDEFDPTRTDSEPLPDSTVYNYSSFRVSYRSDQRKKFFYRLSPSAGEFFNGYRYGMSGSLTYRYQPYGSIELSVNYNYIDLPEPHASTGLFLIGPRIDLTFSRSVFLTTFIQYNDQRENVNINTRLQWRFAPVSDFFLVYTDNYLSDGFAVKNRAIVAKVTYWLNL